MFSLSTKITATIYRLFYRKITAHFKGILEWKAFTNYCEYIFLTHSSKISSAGMYF